MTHGSTRRAWARRRREGAGKASGGELVAVDGNPVDAVWADRPEPSAAPAIGPRRRSCRPFERRQARRGGRLAQVREARRGGHQRARFGRLAAQHSRRRCRPYPGRAVLCHRACRRHRRPVHRAGKGHARTDQAPRQCGDDPPADRLRGRAWRAWRARPSRSIPTSASRRSSRRSNRPGRSAVAVRDPTILPKAIKNPVEQQGQRDAQARDGAAVARFLRWLESEAPKGGETELSAAARAAGLPRGNRAAQGPVVRHHLRRRTARGDPALPGRRGQQPADRAGQRLPGRFGRPVRRRHDRHHPHRMDRAGRTGSPSRRTATPAS